MARRSWQSLLLACLISVLVTFATLKFHFQDTGTGIIFFVQNCTFYVSLRHLLSEEEQKISFTLDHNKQIYKICSITADLTQTIRPRWPHKESLNFLILLLFIVAWIYVSKKAKFSIRCFKSQAKMTKLKLINYTTKLVDGNHFLLKSHFLVIIGGHRPKDI